MPRGAARPALSAGMRAMAKDTVTLKADGVVSIADFHVVVGVMADVLDALTAEATSNTKTVEWVIDRLKAGSAVVVGRGLAETHRAAGAVEEVVKRYDRLARKAHEGRLDEFSEPIQAAVRKLADLVNGKITQISMKAGDEPVEWAINPSPKSQERAGVDVRRYARSAVTGQIVTLDEKHALYFTLREAHTGRLIRCYPGRSYKQDISGYWASSTWVIVEGTFSRYTVPPTMYDVTEIVPLESAPRGSWRDAAGCAPRDPDGTSMSSADAVRRVRDGD
jgi:hypothetical protein